ncbi:formate dehydrogenase alpha subunit [Desulfuromusa kysingii]|uniref:NADPH-Fe(3+) oxidoreductase subunit alpha n=1 Tax=Desulfuromusa kysingii TaxID=37625 RepID=A0A1H3VJG9_9BACT|nr:molybdopterin-dependent oxidoreductase [Desulfuromusa kysingii]SDZ74916.1 formate dehydrogenase alpha subunit [Desulfuromusa kysingii]
MVNLTIDGKSVSVPKDTTILEAARQVDIHIPTLCWLEKVSPTGACRICAVEIEGVDRPMTACNTPVKEGIKVTTQSEKLKKSRRQIMELILVNHPLDCPVCDAGGECDLQDICYELDVVRQEFQADDVNPETINHWPLIQQVPNRCILCEKCVKVCHELIGADALFVNDKGDRAFIDKKLENCTYCGNCVAVCPTGTMISKPFKFKARPWTLRKAPSVCTYCPSQCQIDLNVLNNDVLRVTSEDVGTTNKGTLCIGGFFGSSYINHQQRLTEPLVEQKSAPWAEALDRIVAEVKKIKVESGAAAIAGLSSPHLTNEENYLFQKLFRTAIGSNNIDTEARFGALRALRALGQGLGLHGASNQMDVIGAADAVLVFGADPSAEAPAVDWKIQDAVRRGDGALVIANMRQIHLTQFAESQLSYKPDSEIALANGLGRLLLDRHYLDDDYLKRTVSNFDEMKADLAAVDLDTVVESTGLSLKALEDAADIIGKASKVAVIFGADICKSEFGTSKAAAVANLAILSGALREDGGLFPLDEKGNTQGVLNMGVYPENLPGFQSYGENKAKFAKEWRSELPEGGLDADGILQEIEAGTIRFLYLAATNPQNFPNSSRWMKALEQVEFLVVQDIFPTEVTRLATVVLPGCTYAEKSGSFTSLDQTVRSFKAAIKPVGQCREDWEIFAELYARLSKNSMTQDRDDVMSELRKLTSLYTDVNLLEDKYATSVQKPHQVADQSLKYQLISVSKGVDGLQLLTGTSSSHFGTTSTWASAPLEVEAEGLIRVNLVDAKAAGINDGDEVKVTSVTGSTQGKVLVTESVPAGLIFAPHNFVTLGAQQLLADGSNMTPVQMVKI